MPEVITVTPEMAAQIIPLLREHFRNPPLSDERWMRLFSPPWASAGHQRGYALVENGQIAGFLGTLRCVRTIGGREHSLCNITTFVTNEECRRHSLLLLKPLLAMDDWTLTCFTPREVVRQWLLRMGFEDLDREMHVLLPIPEVHKIGSVLRYRVDSAPERVRALLSDQDLAIFQSHQLPNVWHMTVSREHDYSYLVLTKTRGRRHSFAQVHHVSNVALFLAALNQLKFHIARLVGTPLILLFPRQLQGHTPPYCRTVPISHPAVFKSQTLSAAEIDSLYSELILLGL